MDILLHKLGAKVKGIIEGFDRIVFKGFLKPIAFSAGMQRLLQSHGVLNKDYKTWIMEQSASIIENAEQFVQANCGTKIQYIPSSNERKEALAHERQRQTGIKSGLIGAWSCVEACSTYHSTFNFNAGFPLLQRINSRCKHLYFYFDDCALGFMSIRLQTWAPYGIQIALNGREWLRRLLEKEGSYYLAHGNKFLDLDNYELAQRLLDSQIETKWIPLLSKFLPQIFPSLRDIVGEIATYTWTLWQSEWARDYIFEDPESLKSHMDDLLSYALITGTSERILKYMGKPVKADGQPHHAAKPELITRVNQWYDGVRVRHWVGQNSLKFYNEQNVLRFEMTMNDPTKYRIHRHIEGQKESSKKLLPMRKGIADIAVRTKICHDRINSFTEHMGTFTDKTPIKDIFMPFSKPVISNGKRFRALDIFGKDQELLLAIADPKYNVEAITNKQLQQQFKYADSAKGLSQKQLSSRIGRQLRLLREHGIIKKLPNQRKYALTENGRTLTTAMSVLLSASTQKLLKMVA